jgi:hypothetical protein
MQECVPLLDIAMRRQLLTLDEHARLMSEEISRMVSGLIKGLDRRTAVEGEKAID